jgi:hypothetical protein
MDDSVEVGDSSALSLHVQFGHPPCLSFLLIKNINYFDKTDKNEKYCYCYSIKINK